jgi:CBS-domain-containing membrane protein
LGIVPCVHVRVLLMTVCAQGVVVHREWLFIVTPALTGAIILVVVAVLGHNLTGVRRYPKYWW